MANNATAVEIGFTQRSAWDPQRQYCGLARTNSAYGTHLRNQKLNSVTAKSKNGNHSNWHSEKEGTVQGSLRRQKESERPHDWSRLEDCDGEDDSDGSVWRFTLCLRLICL